MILELVLFIPSPPGTGRYPPPASSISSSLTFRACQILITSQLYTCSKLHPSGANNNHQPTMQFKYRRRLEWNNLDKFIVVLLWDMCSVRWWLHDDIVGDRGSSRTSPCQQPRLKAEL